MDPKSRPVKRRKVDADELGFQYMAKELPGHECRGIQCERAGEAIQQKLGDYLAEQLSWDEAEDP
eukprot:404927-Hanusia_phi.AAC.1